MKQIWPDYSYSPATNVLTLTGLNIDRDQLLLVAAPERGRIMYNFADSSVTASAFTSGANTSLTLVATTAGLTTTAALVIYYDDQLQSTSVSISNFPATQTIAGTVTVGSLPAISGTVTANLSSSNLNTVTIGVRGSVTVGNTTQITDNVVAGFNNTFGNNDTLKVDIRTPDGSVLDGEASVPVQGTVDIGSLPAISGTVTVGNSVTIGSLPAISGTVTANTVYATNVTGNAGLVASTVTAIPVALVDRGVYGGNIMSYDGSNTSLNINVKGSLPSLAAGTAQIGSVTASISNSVTIASFATSVTARLINPAGTAVTYAEVGTAGSPSIDVLSVQGVTSGTPLTILNHQGTAVTTSDFTSTTASTLLAGFNAGREVLTIFNEGAGNLHICAGATCTTIAYQVRLSAGDYYEVPNHQTTITHSAVFATAGTARVTQVS
jgi:trimeric autotransporter adhesin